MGKIYLKNFEDFIEPKILKRGRDYFDNGYVYDIQEKSKGIYSALVSGSEEYEVMVEMRNNEIENYNCDCPYDYGVFCKHIVAVLYHIRDVEMTIIVDGKTSEKRRKPKIDFDEILKNIQQKELIDFLKDEFQYNLEFKTRFVSRFASRTGNDSVEFYAKQLKSLFKSHSDHYGFIDYYKMNKLSKELVKYTDSIEANIEQGLYASAFNMASAMLEEGILLMESCDDSNGVLGDCINEVVSAICQLVVIDDVEDDLKNQIFQFCLNKFDKKEFEGWDWHFEMLNGAEKIAKTPAEYKEITDRIDKGSFSEYWREEAEELKYKILLKINPLTAEQYLKEHLGNHRLRQKAINLKIQKFEYDEAEKICWDGVNYDKNDKPGLVGDWYRNLLKIAKLRNDQSKIIEFARWLFINNFRNEEDYFKLLKETVKKEGWKGFAEQLITDISKQKYGRSSALLPRIYIEEKIWKALLDYVKEMGSVHTLKEYEKYLIKDYLPEVIAIYEKNILKMLERTTGRGEYQNACFYIQKIAQLGDPAKANELIAFLKDAYPKRRALMEELNKIK